MSWGILPNFTFLLQVLLQIWHQTGYETLWKRILAPPPPSTLVHSDCNVTTKCQHCANHLVQISCPYLFLCEIYGSKMKKVLRMDKVATLSYDTRKCLLNRFHFITDVDRPPQVLILPKILDKWTFNFLSYYSSKLAENANLQNWPNLAPLGWNTVRPITVKWGNNCRTMPWLQFETIYVPLAVLRSEKLKVKGTRGRKSGKNRKSNMAAKRLNFTWPMSS